MNKLRFTNDHKIILTSWQINNCFLPRKEIDFLLESKQIDLFCWMIGQRSWHIKACNLWWTWHLLLFLSKVLYNIDHNSTLVIHQKNIPCFRAISRLPYPVYKFVTEALQFLRSTLHTMRKRYSSHCVPL